MDAKTAKILEASYKPQREAESSLSELGYKYDPQLSSMDTKVFYDPATNEPHIAYRGSVRASDWLDNLNLGLGGKSYQKEEAIQTAKKVKEKYGKAPTTYGHSRGGYFSEVAAEETGGKSITYNKATLPKDVFKKIGSNQTDIRTKYDIVSLPSYFQSATKKITLNTPFTLDVIKSHSIKTGKTASVAKNGSKWKFA